MLLLLLLCCCCCFVVVVVVGVVLSSLSLHTLRLFFSSSSSSSSPPSLPLCLSCLHPVSLPLFPFTVFFEPSVIKEVFSPFYFPQPCPCAFLSCLLFFHFSWTHRHTQTHTSSFFPFFLTHPRRPQRSFPFVPSLVPVPHSQPHSLLLTRSLLFNLSTVVITHKKKDPLGLSATLFLSNSLALLPSKIPPMLARPHPLETPITMSAKVIETTTTTTTASLYTSKEPLLYRHTACLLPFFCLQAGVPLSCMPCCQHITLPVWSSFL